MTTYANLCESNLRKNVMITLPRELLRESHQRGLNISRIAENALSDAISRLDFGIERARRDLNPRPLTPEASVISWLSRHFHVYDLLRPTIAA